MQFPANRTLRSLAIAAACAIVVVHATAVRAQDSQPASAVGAAAVAQVTARIVHIDTDENSVTLRGPQGNQMIVDVDPEVADVKKLKVGDQVHIAYKGALLLSADKVDTKGVRSRVETQATTPSSNGASTQVRSVEVVATVQKIDRKKRQVTLRGPKRTVTLQVSPEVPLDKLKVGDSVRANYASATAVQITRDGAPVQ
jgi:Cu/Ag efflux protein CusF